MTTAKAEFVQRHRSLEWLEPVFDSLEDVINEYVDCEEEPPYWNNERPNVSLLLAAAASADLFIELSEYPVDKNKDGKRVDGRCDLYIAKKSPYRYLEMEAKSYYVRQKEGSDKIKRDLENAYRSAYALYDQKPRCQAGLLFEVMTVPENEIDDFDIKKFKKIFKDVKSDFCWFSYDSDLNKRSKKGTTNLQVERRGRPSSGCGRFSEICRLIIADATLGGCQPNRVQAKMSCARRFNRPVLLP